jgi:hypothetical protein
MTSRTEKNEQKIFSDNYKNIALLHCHYPYDEDLNIWEELGANKLALGELKVPVSRT